LEQLLLVLRVMAPLEA
jgi:hypothetical protein